MISPAHIDVIIPALNEASAIADVVRALRSELPELNVTVIDDGSSDGTGDLARAAGANVLRHPNPRGYGASLRTGILAAERDYVLFCDADGQHSAADVRRVIEAIGDNDMVVGARGADSHSPASRRPGKRIIRWYADHLAGQKIPDVNSGLRAIKRDVILRYLHLMPTGFSFSTTSTFALIKGLHNVAWIPITVVKRKGTSTVKQFKHGPMTLLLILRLTVLFEPLRVFLEMAGILLALTLLSLAKDLVMDFGKGLGAVTVVLALATLLVFLFGLLCDQVSAIRREMHDLSRR